MVYLSEKNVKNILIEQNEALMERLTQAGLTPHQLIYVQVHDAGSSSALMLNMLRDEARLRTARLLLSRCQKREGYNRNNK